MQNKKTILIIIGILLTGGFTTLYVLSKIQSKKTGETVSIKNFMPFGINSSKNDNQDTNFRANISNEEAVESEPAQIINNLKKLTDFSVSGVAFLNDHREIIKETTEAPIKEKEEVLTPELEFEIVPSIKYVRRSNGHIYQQYLDSDLKGEISNSTIPAIYEAIFSGDTKSLIFRYLSNDGKTISSYLGTLGAKQGKFLSENIYNIVISPNGKNFFSLEPSSVGVIGIIKSFTKTKQSQIFTSSFTEWIPQWVNNQTIYLTTKASSSVLGYVYSLNTSNGSFNKLFGGIYGLTTLGNPDGSKILYSSSTSSGPKLTIFNIKDRLNTEVGLYGLPEKCVWTSDSLYIYCGIPNHTNQNLPDLWYQGITSFDDSFVKIDASLGNYSNIDTSASESIDATHLFLGNNENNLFFVNKKDYTLWNLDLN